jgi:3-oxoacyl-[acyl-carrier-protein] synthase-3
VSAAADPTAERVPAAAAAGAASAATRWPPVGIAGVHVELGEDVLTAKDFGRQTGIPSDIVVQKLGFHNLARWGLTGHLTALRKACAGALGGLDPAKVDVVMSMVSPPHTEAEIYGYATKVRDLLGCTNADVLDVTDACTSSCLTIQLARELLIAEPHLKNVLIVGMLAVWDAVDITNPTTTWIANISDGAGAMLIQRNPDLDNVILETGQTSHAEFMYDTVFTPGDAKRWGVVTHKQRYRKYAPRRFDVVDKEAMKKRLDPVAQPAFVEAMDQSLKASGLGRKDVDYLGLNHMKPSLWKSILAEFGKDPSSQIYLSEFGHTSFLDQFTYVERIREEGRLPEGGILVLGTPGIGFHWAATTVAFKGPRTRGLLA